MGQIDKAVLCISTSAEVLGLVQNPTSCDSATVGSGNVVNDVQFAYNGFQQLLTDYQSHSGAVNVSTTPKVQYAYASGSANTIRPTSVTYPNGRALNYDYGTSGGLNDSASRIASLIDNDGTTHLADYSYLGAGTPPLSKGGPGGVASGVSRMRFYQRDLVVSDGNQVTFAQGIASSSCACETASQQPTRGWQPEAVGHFFQG